MCLSAPRFSCFASLTPRDKFSSYSSNISCHCKTARNQKTFSYHSHYFQDACCAVLRQRRCQNRARCSGAAGATDGRPSEGTTCFCGNLRNRCVDVDAISMPISASADNPTQTFTNTSQDPSTQCISNQVSSHQTNNDSQLLPSHATPCHKRNTPNHHRS